MRPRIGDVLVAGRGSFALVDSRTARPQVLKLIGQHGSLTAAEHRGAAARRRPLKAGVDFENAPAQTASAGREWHVDDDRACGHEGYG